MGKLIEFLTDRFWGEKPEPQINVSVQRIDTSAEPQTADQAENFCVTWSMKLLLQNQTDAFAADLKLLWPRGKQLFHTQLPYHLDAFQDKVAKFVVERTLASETLHENRTPAQLWEHLPEEFQNLTLVLSYRSRRGDTFYTKYSSSQGTERCEFSQTPPREFVEDVP